MFADERIEKIKTLLLDYRRIDTNTLISMLPASAATIRRDLERLESEGFLKRTHGGAVLVEPDARPAFLPNDEMLSNKKEIGVLAAEMINDGDTVFLGAGTTCRQIATYLRNKQDVKVVTNDIGTIIELLNSEDCRVMVPGGELERSRSGCRLAGRHALRNISNFYFQKCFITVTAANMKAGYMVDTEDEAELCHTLMDHSDETILVIDYSKFGQHALIPLCPLHTIKIVITNMNVPDEYKTYYYDHDVNIFIAIGDL